MSAISSDGSLVSLTSTTNKNNDTIISIKPGDGNPSSNVVTPAPSQIEKFTQQLELIIKDAGAGSLGATAGAIFFPTALVILGIIDRIMPEVGTVAPTLALIVLTALIADKILRSSSTLEGRRTLIAKSSLFGIMVLNLGVIMMGRRFNNLTDVDVKSLVVLVVGGGMVAGTMFGELERKRIEAEEAIKAAKMD